MLLQLEEDSPLSCIIDMEDGKGQVNIFLAAMIQWRDLIFEFEALITFHDRLKNDMDEKGYGSAWKQNRKEVTNPFEFFSERPVENSLKG